MLSQRELLLELLAEAEQTDDLFCSGESTSTFDVCALLWAEQVQKYRFIREDITEQEASEVITKIRSSVISLVDHYLSVDQALSDTRDEK